MTKPSQQGSLIVFGVALPALHAQRIAAMASRPARVVIVDPLIDPAAPPPGLVNGAEQTTIVDCILGARDGEAPFQVWSGNAIMGPRAPSPALYALFPGLRPVRQSTVRVRTIETLSARFGELPDPVSIWIDAPGSEGEVLDLILASRLAARVTDIAVRTGVEAFFDGAGDSHQLIQRLAARHFKLVARDDHDPDFPELRFAIEKPGAAPVNAPAAQAGAKAPPDGPKTAQQEQHKAPARLQPASGAPDSAQHDVASLLAQKQVLEARLHELIADNASLNAQIGALFEELASRSEADAQSTALQAEVTEIRQAAEAAVSRSEETARAQAEARAALESELAAAQKGHDAALAKAHEARATLESELAAARRDRDAALTDTKDARAALQAEREASARAADAHTQAGTALESELAAARRDRDAALADTKDARAALQAERDASARATSAHTKARTALESELAAAHQDRDAALAAAKDARAAVETEREAHARTAREQSDLRAAIEAELKSAKQDRQEIWQSRDKLRAERDAAQVAVTQVQATLDEQRKSKALADSKRDEALAAQAFQTRFQAMMQIDITNLRDRLEVSETQRKRQEDLLRKLTAKLEQAAEFLHQFPDHVDPKALGHTDPPAPRRRVAMPPSPARIGKRPKG